MKTLVKISIFIALFSSIILVIFPDILNNKLISINNLYKYFDKYLSKESKTSCLSPGERLLTKTELSRYDGSSDSLGLYLAFLGIVYDVSKGAQHYKPGGSYSFFAGKDATRAYITGQFTEEGLIDDLTGVDVESFDGIQTWTELYEKDYKRVGKLIGTYYDSNGCQTEALLSVHKKMDKNNEIKEQQNQESEVFPYCNSEWSGQTNSGRVWCSRASGGRERDWIGVPRQLFMTEKKQYRCACVRNTGPPTVPAIVYEDDTHDYSADSNVGDLNNPRLKEYDGCDPQSIECKIQD